MNNVYILLKPEVRNYLEELDDHLSDSGFSVLSRHPVYDWEGLSRVVYKPQLTDNESFAAGTMAYFWLSRHLFGNNSAVFLLDNAEKNLQEKLNHLDEFKRKFRLYISSNGADAIKIFLDMDKLRTEGKEEIGVRGDLGIAGDLNGVRFGGKWDHYYFKYIHTPDPKEETIKYEMEVLRDFGVFTDAISEDEWSFMKKIETLTPPSLIRQLNKL